MTVIEIVMIVVVASMVLILLRVLAGATLFDRILAVNSFASKAMVLLALLSVWLGESMLLDIALVYALVNFITTIAYLNYVKNRSLGDVL